MAKLELMTAASTSSSVRGTWAASTSWNLMFFLFSAMSPTVAFSPTPSLLQPQTPADSAVIMSSGRPSTFPTSRSAPLAR